MKKQHYESACPLLSPLTPTPTPTPCEMECKRIAVKSSRVPLRFRMRSKRKGDVPCAFPYIRQALPHLTPCPSSHPTPCPSFASTSSSVASFGAFPAWHLCLPNSSPRATFPTLVSVLERRIPPRLRPNTPKFLTFVQLPQVPCWRLYYLRMLHFSICKASLKIYIQIKLMSCNVSFAFKKRCDSFLGKL